MKKNDWSIIISVVLYSVLFYKQFAGLNFFIFNLAIVILLLYRDLQLLKNWVWISVAAGAIVSSFFIFWYSSALAIVSNVFSLLTLSALSIEVRTSFITGICLTACSVTSSCVFMFLDWIERKTKQVSETYSRPFYVKLFLIVIPFLIAVLFFVFYQSANPLFYDFTKKINLDWISINWILFTMLGLLMMYGFFHNTKMKSLYSLDINSPLILTPEIASTKSLFKGLMRNDTENLSGIILFGMLNTLLLIVNTLDLHYLWFDGKLPQGISNKEFVHNGVGTLITSIIIAILIILFYFRGELNFYKKSKAIKWMSYIWIAQNAFMIFSTAFRNNMYIAESGLSYKKIGVYVYLLLTLIGLATTLIKVWKIKTNWYLFRVNAAWYYYLLVLFCIFNWDVIITDFNIRKYSDEKKELEKYFLLDLSYKNLPQLLSLPDSVASKDDFSKRDYYSSSRGVFFYTFKNGLSKKLYNFMQNYIGLEWQSLCVEKKRTYHDLFVIKDKVQSLDFSYYTQSLKPLSMFSNLRSLNYTNGKPKDLNELKYFPKLEKLDMSNNMMDTIRDLPPLQCLTELHLTNNSIYDITPIGKLKSLEVLDLSGENHIKSYSPLLECKNLKVLSIGKITKEGLAVLQKTFPNVTINAVIIDTNYETRY